MFLRLIVYLAAAGVVYHLCRSLNRGEGSAAESDNKIFFIVAMLWPLTLAPMLLFLLMNQIQARHNRSFRDFNRPDGPAAAWERRAPKGDYNNMAFGANDKGDEDMAEFIASLETRPDAALKEELTITYGPSGISKTYPAGTLFPSALLRDWKAGHFMARRGADE